MEKLIDALYSRLLLRDVFGKVVPGAIVLFTFVITLTSPEAGRNTITTLPFGAWIVVFGLAWVVGFAVQSFGEWALPGSMKLLRYFPKDVDEKKWLKLRAKFRIHPDYDKHTQNHERLVVIKEACGNSYISLSISTILWLVDRLLDMSADSVLREVLDHVHLVILDLGVILLLARMHFVHVQRQHDLLLSVIGEADTT